MLDCIPLEQRTSDVVNNRTPGSRLPVRDEFIRFSCSPPKVYNEMFTRIQRLLDVRPALDLRELVTIFGYAQMGDARKNSWVWVCRDDGSSGVGQAGPTPRQLLPVLLATPSPVAPSTQLPAASARGGAATARLQEPLPDLAAGRGAGEGRPDAARLPSRGVPIGRQGEYRSRPQRPLTSRFATPSWRLSRQKKAVAVRGSCPARGGGHNG